MQWSTSHILVLLTVNLFARRPNYWIAGTHFQIRLELRQPIAPGLEETVSQDSNQERRNSRKPGNETPVRAVK